MFGRQIVGGRSDRGSSNRQRSAVTSARPRAWAASTYRLVEAMGPALRHLIEPLEARFLLAADAGVEALGLRPPTPEELEWDRQNLIVTEDVRLNQIGLDRVNADRAQQGLSPLLVDPSPQGEEVIGATLSQGLYPSALGDPFNVGIPLAVDNSQNQYFPPIRTQGIQGSCAAFSTTYYTMTYMTALARGWDVRNAADNTNKFSPKWTYNMIDGGADNGSWLTTSFDIMLQHGSATWAQFPYVDTEYRQWVYNKPDVWRSAINYRMNQSGVVPGLDTDAGLANVKAMLANGYILNYATNINGWTFKPIGNDPGTSADDAYVGKDCAYYVQNNPSGHGMTVVGYNDNIWVDVNANGSVDAGEKGAFRIANSWGTSWKEAGFTWISYDALKTVSAVAGGPSTNREAAWWYASAYWMNARASYTPTLLGQFTIQHAKRDQLYMNLGAGTTGTTPSSTWIPTALTGDGGAYGFDGVNYAANPSAAPAGTFVFDFTDLNPTPGIAKRYFLGLDDYTDAAFSGTVTDFRLTSATGSALSICPTGASAGNVPQTDADGADILYAFTDSTLSGILVDASAVGVSEGGSTTFQVRLSTAPAANLVVSVARTSGDTDLSISSGALLTFTTANWSTWQTVTIAAAQDADMVNGSATITCSTPGMTSVELIATEIDDDQLYSAKMDINPGWTISGGQWAFGHPAGLGGSTYGHPDPSNGYTGGNVYGVNLSGDYSTAVGGPYYLTTLPIDCSGYSDIHLNFRRWLNTDYVPFGRATIDVSNNGSTWTNIYINPSNAEVADSSWQLMDYNISSVADNHAAVYIRWGYQIGSSVFPYSGWNIDDVTLTGAPIYLPGVDLVGTALTIAPKILGNSGGHAAASFTFANQRSDAAGAFDVKFYLSDDATIDPAIDILLTLSAIDPKYDLNEPSAYHVSILGGMASLAGSAMLDVPVTDPFATDNSYYIGMLVDADANVVETDETNNRNRGEGIDRGAVSYTWSQTCDFIGGLPAGWTVVDGYSDGKTWTSTNPGGRSNANWSGTFMIVDSDWAGTSLMDESLITKSFDLSGYGTAHLDFTHYFYYFGGGQVEVGDVDYRLSGGAWENVARYTAADASGAVSIALPSSVNNQPDVQIRWHYYNASWDWFWGIDNVAISAIGMDVTPPTVAGVSSTAANGAYGPGAAIPIRMSFSENVTVNTAGGTPSLSLNSGGTAIYAGGSGTKVLTFNYIVAPGQNSPDLDYSSVAAVAGNGGTIRDAAGNSAILTLPATGGAGSLGANAAIVVDTIAPAISGTWACLNGNASADDGLVITFSEPLNLTLFNLLLRRDAGANLLSSAQSLVSTPDHRTWTLGGLADLAAPEGYYGLTFTGVTDAAGNALPGSTEAGFLQVVGDSNPLESNDIVRLQPDQYDPTMLGVLINGTPEYMVPMAGMCQAIFNGGNGDDVLTVAAALPFSPSFNGGTGLDTLNLDGVTFTFSVDARLGTDSLTVNLSNAASVTFDSSQHLASLDLASAAQASLAAGGNRVIVTGNLTMAPGTQLNLNDNDLLIRSGDLATIRGLVLGHLVRTDSTSSPIAGKSTGLGYAQGDDPAIGWMGHVFDGEAFAGAAVIVKYTFTGDANLDGSVDGSDVALWAQNFSGALGTNPEYPRAWTQGDWNRDGSVDGSDVALWAQNFTGALGGGGLAGDPTPLSAGTTADADPVLTVLAIQTATPFASEQISRALDDQPIPVRASQPTPLSEPPRERVGTEILDLLTRARDLLA